MDTQCILHFLNPPDLDIDIMRLFQPCFQPVINIVTVDMLA